MTSPTPNPFGDEPLRALDLEPVEDADHVTAMTSHGSVHAVPRFRLNATVAVFDWAVGGNGVVLFCVRHGYGSGATAIPTAFAAKTLRPDRAFSREARERFRSECLTWLQVSHAPNVLPAEQIFDINGRPFITMPLVLPVPSVGIPATLRELMLRPISLDLALFLASECAVGMASIEARGIDVVHGDLKPENYLMYHVRPHVSDFGSASLHEGRRAGLGTTAYLPPEARRSGRIESKAGDVYAYGAILREILSKVSPAGTAFSEPSSPAQTVARALIDIADRSTADNPRDRFPDFTALVTALDAPALSEYRETSGERDQLVFMASTMRWASELTRAAFPTVDHLESLRELGHVHEVLEATAGIDGLSDVNPDVMLVRARALTDLEEYAEAAALLHCAIAADAKFPESMADALLDELGIVYKRMGDFELAVSTMQQALDASRTWWDTRRTLLNIAGVHVDKREYDSARRVMGQVLAIEPENVTTLFWLARIELWDGNYPRAEQLAERACALAPEDSNAHLLYAEALLRTSRWDLAALECDLALRCGAELERVGRLMFLTGYRDSEVAQTSAYRQLLAQAPAEALVEWEESAKQFYASSLVPVNEDLAVERPADGLGGLFLPEHVLREQQGSIGAQSVTAKPPSRTPAQGWHAVLDGLLASGNLADALLFAQSKLPTFEVDPGSPDHLLCLQHICRISSLLSRPGSATAAGAELVALVREHEQPCEVVCEAVFSYVQALAVAGERRAVIVNATEALVLVSACPDSSHLHEPLLEMSYDALVYVDDGDQARTTIRQLVALRSERYGPDDPRTLRARHNWVMCEVNATDGDASVAADELRQVLRTRRRVLGYDDPATLNSTCRLPDITGMSGNARLATWEAEQAACECARVYGAFSAEAFQAWITYARWLCPTGYPELADKFLADMRESVVGAELAEDVRGEVLQALDSVRAVCRT